MFEIPDIFGGDRSDQVFFFGGGGGGGKANLRLQIVHLTTRLKLQSSKTPVKFDGIFSKVNQVSYTSSWIS